MADIAKTASRGHHTFYLSVWNTGKTWVESGGAQGAVEVGYKFSMYGGSYDFNWTSKSVYWNISVGENSYSGSFGKYDQWKTKVLAEGTCWVYQTSNGAATHSFSFSVDDTIDQWYTPGDIAKSDTNSTFTTTNLTLWTIGDYPYANIVKNGQKEQYGDNGDNSATIIITDGDWNEVNGGTNNPISYCATFYKFNNETDWTYKQSSSSLPKFNVYIGPGCTQLDLKGTAARVKYGGDSTYGCIYGYQGGQNVKYYSRPNPPQLKISTTVNGNKVSAVISASPGAGGSNNEAVGVELAYSIGGGNKITATSNPYTIENIDISNLQNITAYARTIGKEDRNVYTNNTLTTKENIKYSKEVSVNTSSTNVSKPGAPDLQIIDHKNNTFGILYTQGSSGDNNSAIDTEVYYTTDGTSPINGNTLKSNAKKYEGGYVSVLSDSIIKVVARTIGVHPAYKYSAWSEIKEHKVLFYNTPNISAPVISWEKKLTKKSKIDIEQHIIIPKHDKLLDCTIYFYKNGKECVNYDYKSLNIYNDESDQPWTLHHSIYLTDLNEDFNFKKDDVIYVLVNYIIVNGKGDNLVNQMLLPQSNWCMIESSGVMRTNANNQWHEGQVWVNIDSIWKEATDIFVNTEGQWKESI